MITQIITEQMHPADIQASLKKVGVSQVFIAESLGISETGVNNVIYGRSTSKRVATLIAEKIGKKLDEIWPGRYTEKGA